MKNSRIKTHVLFVSLSLLVLFAVAVSNSKSSVFAQSTVSNDVKRDTQGQPIKRDQAVHIDVNLALVNVTVTDPYNRLVTGLEPDNFRIFEDNIEQEVVNFSSEDVPISIGVVLDLSGSMAYKLGKAKEAALQFFKTGGRPPWPCQAYWPCCHSDQRRHRSIWERLLRKNLLPPARYCLRRSGNYQALDR